MLVDYHFHPNLSKHDGRARRKCRQIWERFAQAQLDVVMVTEHVFKNPERAFRLLASERPSGARTVIFPGLEALTSEGVDIIVFAESTIIFEQQKLMVPKQLSIIEMAQYIHDRTELYGSIAHPRNLGHSGAERRVGLEKTIQAIRLIGGVEIHNTCFKGACWFFDHTRLSHIMRRNRRAMAEVMNLPKEYYTFPEVELYTGGSDAHVLVEIGPGMIVTDPNNRGSRSLFLAAAHNRNTKMHETAVDIHLFLAFYKGYSILNEALIKAFRLYEGKLYQNDDRFTNYYSEAEKETVLELRHRRARLLKPLLNFLTYFALTPTSLNIIGIVTLIMSMILVWEHTYLAVLTFIIYLLTAGFVAPLARYQNLENEMGALTKIMLYILSLTMVVVSGIALDWIEPVWGALYLVLYILMLWLTITLNKVGQPIRLVVRSKPLLLLTMFLLIMTGINVINIVTVVFVWYMAIINAVMLIRLRRAVLPNDKISKKNNQL